MTAMLAFGLSAGSASLSILAAAPRLPLCARPAPRRAPAPRALAGFGAGTPHDAKASASRKPPKKQRTIRATYLDLVNAGCTEYVCFARATGAPADMWKRVGTIVAEGDRANVSVAVTSSKRAVLEHAKRLWPQLGLAKALEVGCGKDGDDLEAVEVCEKMPGTCTSAFSPDAVSTPFYVRRTGDGRAAPVDTSSTMNKGKRPGSAFPPRGKGEGKTPGDS